MSFLKKPLKVYIIFLIISGLFINSAVIGINTAVARSNDPIVLASVLLGHRGELAPGSTKYFNWTWGNHLNGSLFNASNILGPEKFRRDIAVGRLGDYPIIGPYDDTSNETLKWQMLTAKSAGIDGFLIYVVNYNDGRTDDPGHTQRSDLEQVFSAAEEVDFKVGLVDHYVRTKNTSADPLADNYMSPNTSRYPDIIYEAEDLPFLVGQNINDLNARNTRAREAIVSVSNGVREAGWVSYGPNESIGNQIGTGPHVAYFSFLVDNNSADDDPIVTVEVYDADTGKTLASNLITRKMFTTANEYVRFPLYFNIEPEKINNRLEFRTYWHGYSYLRQDLVSVYGDESPNPNDFNDPTDPGAHHMIGTPFERAATVQRIKSMVNDFKDRTGYLRIDGKPYVMIPAHDDFYDGGGYPDANASADYTFDKKKFPEALRETVANLRGQIDENIFVSTSTEKVTNFNVTSPASFINLSQKPEYISTGIDSFTYWNPVNTIELSAQQHTQIDNSYVNDTENLNAVYSLNLKSTIPAMPAFDNSNIGGQISQGLTKNGRNGSAFFEQIQAAKNAQSDIIFIQSWNEWHEGVQIEPSLGSMDSNGVVRPDLYLTKLALALGKNWTEGIPFAYQQSMNASDSTLKYPTLAAKKSFEVENLNKRTGTNVVDPNSSAGKARVADVATQNAGFLATGPADSSLAYMLGNGSHVAYFRLMVANNTLDNAEIGYLEVYDNTDRKTLGWQKVTRKQFPQSNVYYDFPVWFDLTGRASHSLKLNIYWYDKAWVKADVINVLGGPA